MIDNNILNKLTYTKRTTKVRLINSTNNNIKLRLTIILMKLSKRIMLLIEKVKVIVHIISILTKDKKATNKLTNSIFLLSLLIQDPNIKKEQNRTYKVNLENIIGNSIMKTFVINSSNFTLSKVDLVIEIKRINHNNTSSGIEFIIIITNDNAIILAYSVNTIIE